MAREGITYEALRDTLTDRVVANLYLLHGEEEFLVEEAMTRAGGNQTLAARLLGISQPALSKRLKMMRK